jgi:hypothetical protein
MRPKVRRLTRLADNAYIGALAGTRVAHIERVGPTVDAGDDVLAWPNPLRRITDVGDVLMRTLRMGFDDTGDATVGHGQSPCDYQNR